MSRILDRQKALELRQQGKTYSEIRKELAVAKSTLSDWLRKFPLTDEQMEILGRQQLYKRQMAIEKTRLIKQQKRDQRLSLIYESEKHKWTSLSAREIELAGLFLYWGEGSKNLKGSLSINNSDPLVVKFALFWFMYGLDVPKEKIKVFLHLYSDMNVQNELNFWSQELGLPLSQFTKPYIKQSTRVDINHKGFGHGTCGIRVNDSKLKERVIFGIKAIADNIR